MYLTEDDVQWVLDVETAIVLVEQAFREWAVGRADNQPRRRVSGRGHLLHSMSAAAEYLGFAGAKIYLTSKAGAQFHFVLYDLTDGRPVALMEANHLGQIRTGAATGVAVKAMARPDAALVGCFGAGFQARTQLQAVCAVRKIERALVYCRDEAARKRFAAEMTELCNVDVRPARTPEEAAAEQDLVLCATTAKAPLFDGRVLDEGTHVSAIGSNNLQRAELDVATLRRADHIVCDSREACQLEAGDFLPAIEAGVLEWDRVRNLGDVLVGRETGRARPEDLTVFKSVGLALEDLAVAVHVYHRAQQERLGTELPLG